MKKLLKFLFSIVIILSLVKMCDVNAQSYTTTTTQIYNGNWTQLKMCENNNICNVGTSTSNLDVRHIKYTFSIPINKNKSYTIKGKYRFLVRTKSSSFDKKADMRPPYFQSVSYGAFTENLTCNTLTYNDTENEFYKDLDTGNTVYDFTRTFECTVNTTLDATGITMYTTLYSVSYGSIDTTFYYTDINQVTTNQDIINNSNNNQVQTNQRLDEVNDNLNNIDNSLKDDSTDNDKVEDTFSIIEDRMAKNGTITNLVILPVTLFSKIANSVKGTCQDFSLGELFGNEISFPCIDVGEYLGNTVWSTIDILFTGFFIFVIAKKMLKVFDTFTSLQEGDILD